MLAISSGTNHACAIASDNNAYCWGAGASGQLGNGLSADSSVPVAVSTTGVLSGKTILAIAAGDNYTCAIASDNQAYCWGGNGAGQLGNNSTTPSNTPVVVNTSGVLSGKTVLSLSASVFGSHVCALASDNKTYCWGANSSGQLGNNSTTQSAVPVAVDMTGVLAGKTITLVTTGTGHSCAIASDGLAYCWGSNWGGQLGIGTSGGNSPIPVVVSSSGILSGKTITQIAGGKNNTCAIASDNQAYCWGYGGTGGNGNNGGSSNVPVAVYTAGYFAGKTVLSISRGGFDNACAIASDYKAYCWGNNGTYGMLGDNTTTDRNVPTPVRMTGVNLQSEDYRLYNDSTTPTPGTPLAGVNYGAQLASSGDAFRLRTGLRSMPGIKQLSSGAYHTCVIASDNQAYCWGNNSTGQLGNNSTTQNSVPVAVDTTGVLSGKTVRALSVGESYSSISVCAIASDTQAYCWGSNGYGQLGNNSTTDSHVPVAVSTVGAFSGKTVLEVSMGSSFGCAIASDNYAYCWGSNYRGQLGNNSTVDSSVPVPVDTSGVLSGKTITSIAVGQYHTCAIASDNRAYCWGRGGDGELGNNTTTDALVPVAVAMSGALSGKTITSVSVGSIHTCAIASDNKVYCWGYDGYGQFGNGTNSNSLVPVAAMNTGPLASSTISSLSAGGIHTCVIASDNYEYCSGFNSEGALGNGTTITTNVPTAVDRQGVLAGKTILSMSTNWINSCAVASDNNAYCWGQNSEGQIGNLAVPTYFSTRPTRTATSYMSGPRLFAGDNTFKLQFAKRTTTTCSVQSTGFADVTESSAIAYNTNASVTHTAAISTAANDPVPANDASPQTYQSASGTFTNITDIEPGKTGLWDFSLKTNGAERNTSYCLRLTYGDGTPIELSQAYPEVMVPAASLAVGFVDGVGAPISKPTFAMNATSEKTSLQSVTGTFADSARKLRVFNDLVTNGWSVSLAATTGNTAVWKRSDNLAQYAFNANATSGQLSINPGTGSIASACGTTGTSLGASANFVQGSQDSVTLFTASSAAPLGCAYDFTGAALTQTIPAQQAAGAYTLDMTATVVAL